MPGTESAFVIGVIREKEKTFLQADEYTRLVEARDVEGSRKSLVDTVYGTYMERENSAAAALNAHLVQEWQWLTDVVEGEQVPQFLGARYDGLNIAGMLLDAKADRESLRSWSPLGTVSVEFFQELLREGDLENWESVPVIWRDWLRAEVAQLTDDTWSAGDMLARVKEQVIAVWEETAISPLMKDLTQLWAEHLQYDEAWRKEAGDVAEAKLVPPSFVEEAAVAALQTEESAVPYEQAWDSRIVELLRPSKIVPVGNDPIVAFWVAKEMEVKTIRLLLAAKSGGMKAQDLRKLIRPLYLSL